MVALPLPSLLSGDLTAYFLMPSSCSGLMILTSHSGDVGWMEVLFLSSRIGHQKLVHLNTAHISCRRTFPRIHCQYSLDLASGLVSRRLPSMSSRLLWTLNAMSARRTSLLSRLVVRNLGDVVSTSMGSLFRR